jgi:biotin operon repressor
LNRIAAARADGLSMAEIAARFNCGRDAIQKKLRELQARGAPSAGENCG